MAILRQEARGGEIEQDIKRQIDWQGREEKKKKKRGGGGGELEGGHYELRT